MAPILKASWKEVTQREGAPVARSSHALAVQGPRAFVFGGEFEPRVPIDNSLHVFDLADRRWAKAEAKGDVPEPRIGVAMATLGSVLYVFAGRDNAHEELDEFYCFDTATNEWKKLPTGPPHRSYHTLVANEARNELYMFGGCGKDGRLNDLWAFHVPSNTWKAFPVPSPDVLLPRGGPGLAVCGNSVWVIFGFNGKELNDVHRFDLDAQSWETVSLSGSVKPIPRSVFVACTIGSYIVLYGGEVDPSDLGHMGAGAFSDEVWAIDTEGREWVKPEVVVESGSGSPGGRGWYSAAPVGANQMLVYGGNSATNDRLDDMFLLTVTV